MPAGQLPFAGAITAPSLVGRHNKDACDHAA